MINQNKKTATVDSVLKRSHVNKLGESPVKIRVTYDRVQKFYPVHIDGKPLYMDAASFEKLDKDVRKDARMLKDEIKKVLGRAVGARDKVTNGRTFTFDRFEKEFLNQESKNGILYLFETYLNDLLLEDRIGSYESYKNAYSAFNKFRGGKSKTKESEFVRGKEIKPEDLTVELLKKFDSWLKKQGCNKTTIGIYMRALRIIFNLAVDTNPSLAEFYPFARKSNDNKRYKIRSGSGKKGEAMSAEGLQKFIATEPIEDSPELEAKNYWLFMFYASGMNMADVAQLKYRDIQWDAIRYVRAKTRDTETKEELIEIPLSDSLKKIIIAIGNPDKSPSAYVFPILTDGMTSEEIKAATKQKTKIINKWLKRLCKANGLPLVTTYWARHTAASLLRESGVPVEMISELLGHSDVKVTREYLKRFSVQRKHEAIEGAMEVLRSKAS